MPDLAACRNRDRRRKRIIAVTVDVCGIVAAVAVNVDLGSCWYFRRYGNQCLRCTVRNCAVGQNIPRKQRQAVSLRGVDRHVAIETRNLHNDRFALHVYGDKAAALRGTVDC